MYVSLWYLDQFKNLKLYEAHITQEDVKAIGAVVKDQVIHAILIFEIIF